MKAVCGGGDFAEANNKKGKRNAKDAGAKKMRMMMMNHHHQSQSKLHELS